MKENDDLTLVETPCLALALSGFAAKKFIAPEQAGIFFEVRRLRDRLLFGEDCTDILGPAFLRYIENNGFSSSSADNSDIENLDVDDWLDAEDDNYFKYLKNLDPTAWRDQDHYKVLGLTRLRFKATESQIKIAYRKKVLHHHPDKRRHKGLVVKSGEEDYFTCISKAYETLGNNQKRRAYDSVDPLFDDSVPSTATKENFYKVFGPVFDRNGRWSRKNRVPKFGDDQTSIDEVDKFYKFWFDFDSWREFSYLDEEDKEKGENRDERRWIDKQNKAMRDKRRKDEVKRIRNFVENAYKCDPRVQKHRDDEKQRKMDEKLAKEEAKRAKIEEEERQKRAVIEEEKRKNELEEETRRQQQIAEKREKDALKKSLQKERKALQEFSQKMNFFAPVDDESTRFANMADLDRLGQTLPLEKLKDLNIKLNQATNGTKPGDVFRRFVDDFNSQVELEKKKLLEKLENSSGKGAGAQLNGQFSNCNWTVEENQLLIKAMTLFPVGTKSRWDVIAAFINEHIKVAENECKKTGKDVVFKVKELQKLDDKTKENSAKGLPLLQVKSNLQVLEPPSIRTECPADANSDGNPWTSEEQKRLEQALRSFGADDPERWDKITACLPGRTKKDCVKRYKEIAELVRARKVALEQQNPTNKTKIASGK